MSISNYAELKILEDITGKTPYTAPTTLYIKLHLADPGEDCTTSPAANTTRVAVPSWGTAASGSIASSATISWSNVSTTETYTHWSAWDTVGPTGGNPIWYGALSASAAVTAGDTFEITSLTLSLD